MCYPDKVGRREVGTGIVTATKTMGHGRPQTPQTKLTPPTDVEHQTQKHAKTYRQSETMVPKKVAVTSTGWP